MEITHLVTMVNQIGDFFDAYPNKEEAKKELLNHIKKFWAKEMRNQLIAHAQGSGENLSPIVLEAIKEYSALLA
jgi:formate dehydrogenase subunit delta